MFKNNYYLKSNNTAKCTLCSICVLPTILSVVCDYEYFDNFNKTKHIYIIKAGKRVAMCLFAYDRLYY